MTVFIAVCGCVGRRAVWVPAQTDWIAVGVWCVSCRRLMAGWGTVLLAVAARLHIPTFVAVVFVFIVPGGGGKEAWLLVELSFETWI